MTHSSDENGRADVADACDCLVIGGGPAGLMAALYLQRYHRRVLLVDHGHSRALYIDRSHNYPGFPQVIECTELLSRMHDGRRVLTRSVLLATGVVDGVPDLPGIDAGFEGIDPQRIERVGVNTRMRAGAGAPVLLQTIDGARHAFDVVYAALGVQPRSQLARSLGAQLDGRNNVIVDAHCQTSVKGLYAAGDVVSALDQLAVAVGHGAIAATAIHNGLPDRQPTSGARMALAAMALARVTPSDVLAQQHRKMAGPGSARHWT